MGTGKNKQKRKLHAKKKSYKRQIHKHWSIHGRAKDLDQIHDALDAKKKLVCVPNTTVFAPGGAGHG